MKHEWSQSEGKNSDHTHLDATNAQDSLNGWQHTLAEELHGQDSPLDERLDPEALEDLTLIEELGRGGMGVVYRALQRSLEREVAVKLLHPRLTKQNWFDRFYQEVLLAAKLSHPNIAHIHWVKRGDGLLYYVMEYVPGQSLASLLSRRVLSLTEVSQVFVQVCAGLAHAHERGIVHRDLKPGNIIIESSEQAPRREQSSSQANTSSSVRAVLVDFGLASRAGESSVTTPGALMGTPAYMSPEQVRGEPTDHTSDIYSLGITLFESITGRVPFDAPTPLAMAVKHLSDTPPDPRQLVPNLPSELARLINQMLSKDSAQRPQSSEMLSQALQSILLDSSLTRLSSQVSDNQALAFRELTVLAVDLVHFTANAHDQAIARTAFMLHHWFRLFEQAIEQHEGCLVRRDAAMLVAVFGYPKPTEDHSSAAIGALKLLNASVREFNLTHGRNQAFTAGLESGKGFIGPVGTPSFPTCFGRPLDTAIQLCQVHHCGVGLLGQRASEKLIRTVPLEPLIGVADDLGSATRIAPRFFG